LASGGFVVKYIIKGTQTNRISRITPIIIPLVVNMGELPIAGVVAIVGVVVPDVPENKPDNPLKKELVEGVVGESVEGLVEEPESDLRLLYTDLAVSSADLAVCSLACRPESPGAAFEASLALLYRSCAVSSALFAEARGSLPVKKSVNALKLILYIPIVTRDIAV